MLNRRSVVPFLLVVPFLASVVVDVVSGFPGLSVVEGSQTAPAQANPDSPEVRQLLDTAKKNAGSEWAEAFDFICALNAGRANSPTDPEIEPTRVFDNLYVIGRTSTVVWAVTTTAGIVLIDSGYADQLESVLLPGMKKLGLDPAHVRYVFVGHGHGDHFGGAPYFQQRGARVVMAGPDWDLVESPPPPGRGAAPGGAAPPAARGPVPAPVQPPKRDIVAVEGQAITVGDVAFTPVMIPGHTPGSMGVVFPVKDGRATRMAGLFGGSILTPGRISDAGLRQYIASVEHWGNATRRMKVDVEIQNHPMYDGFVAKLERLKQRKQGEANPFAVGAESYQRFVAVMAGCTRAQLARRPQAAGPAVDEAAVRAVVANYVDARERRDAAAIGALFTPDADQYNSAGDWRRGRDAIVKGTLESSARNTGARRITIQSVRFVAPGVAIADGDYEIGANRMWTTLVLTRQGEGWKISAIRNSRPTGGK
jgi:metallo-beta-lactamase class B